MPLRVACGSFTSNELYFYKYKNKMCMYVLVIQVD